MRNFIEKHIHWLGHSTFKISGGKTIFFDPFEIKATDKADIICISHEHFDHCSPDDVKKIQTENTILLGTEDTLKKLSGNKKVVRPGDKITLGGAEIEVVNAYNTNKKFHPRGNSWVGYIVQTDGFRIYHAGDTDLIPEMKNFKVDIALLPVSGTYVMTAEEAAKAALEIKPKFVIPMHYGAIIGKKADAEKLKELLEGKIEVIIKNPL